MKIEDIQKLIAGKLRGEKKKALEKEIESNAELKKLYLLIKKLSVSSLSSHSELAGAARKLSAKIYSDFQKSLNKKTKKMGVQLFDSSLLPLPEGVRPAAVDTKTLRYMIAQNILEITLYPITIDSVEIIGVVDFDIEQTGSLQVIVKSKTGQFTTTLDEFSLFRFERIPTGKCTLSFYYMKKLLGTVEIEI